MNYRVFKLYIDTGKVELLVSSLWFPIGICFGEEESTVIISVSLSSSIIEIPIQSTIIEEYSFLVENLPYHPGSLTKLESK